jgi:hypothetical protein
VANELISAYGVSPEAITQLRDTDATADAIRSTLKRMVDGLQSGDRFLFWYSGHGTQLVRGDAATDVICPVDFDETSAKSVTVSDFHTIFSGIPDGAVAFWGSDSCHSGDLERDYYRNGVPRQWRRDPALAPTRMQPASAIRMRIISAELPNIVLISGCDSDQTSADANIQGHYHGAFTYFFLQALQSPKGLSMPMTELVPEVLKGLKGAGYRQNPQLSGNPSKVTHPFFG